MSQKRAAGKKIIARSPPNRKFPGEDVLRKCSETMSLHELAIKFNASESTVKNWLKRCKIPREKKKKKSVMEINPNSPVMESWVRVRMSGAQTINGWFRRLPF